MLLSAPALTEQLLRSLPSAPFTPSFSPPLAFILGLGAEQKAQRLKIRFPTPQTPSLPRWQHTMEKNNNKKKQMGIRALRDSPNTKRNVCVTTSSAFSLSSAMCPAGNNYIWLSQSRCLTVSDCWTVAFFLLPLQQFLRKKTLTLRTRLITIL